MFLLLDAFVPNVSPAGWVGVCVRTGLAFGNLPLSPISSLQSAVIPIRLLTELKQVFVSHLCTHTHTTHTLDLLCGAEAESIRPGQAGAGKLQF